ncbi:MAG TPA: DUF4215 domain-containing protein [Myxococcota bacterium]|jgi:cysteine-rich repeat protein
MLVLVAAIALSVPTPVELDASARAAAGEKHYCDAAVLFGRLFAVSHDAKDLYNEAEVAYAADDRLQALQLYRDAQQRFPTYERKDKIAARIAELGASIAKDGVGKACPAPQPECQNGVVETGEECDDGNAIDGDGCDRNCKRTRCGNGVLTAGEQCDDGNNVDGDGCSATCTVPAACGDGRVDAGEQCDDGNHNIGDGCDQHCQLEVSPASSSPAVRAPPRQPASAAPLVVAGVGGVVALAGIVTGVIAALPAIDFLSNESQQTDLEAQYAKAGSDGDRAAVAVQAQHLHQQLDDDVTSWNGAGQWVALVGVSALVVGVGAAAVGGLLYRGADDDSGPLPTPTAPTSPSAQAGPSPVP